MGSTRIKQAYGSLKRWLLYEAYAQFWLSSQPTQCVSGRVRWFALATSILAFTKVIKVRCVIGRPIARNHRAQALAITTKNATAFGRFRYGDPNSGRPRHKICPLRTGVEPSAAPSSWSVFVMRDDLSSGQGERPCWRDLATSDDNAAPAERRA